MKAMWLTLLILFMGVSIHASAPSTSLRRDVLGVWFIKSNSVYGAYQAQGYAVAEDRLWQLELFRRNGRGKLAELFGPDFIGQDAFIRTIGYSDQELDEAFADLSPRLQQIVTAYMAGVNRRIAEVRAHPALLPGEFKALSQPGKLFFPADWTTRDVLAWLVLLSRQFDPQALLTGQLDNALLLQELQAAFPQASDAMFSDLRWLNDPDAQTMIPQDNPERGGTALDTPGRKGNVRAGLARTIDRFNRYRKTARQTGTYAKLGSYAWAVSGKRTRSGKPVLVSGPQLGFSVPSVVHEGSMEYPGYRVSGMGIAGVPGLVLGRTPNHAWSLQVGHAQTVDYFLEAPAAVRFHRLETIHVAGAPPVELPVFRTVHGPVIEPLPFDPANPQAGPIFSWSYAHWGREFDLIESLLKIGSARSIEQFGKAIDLLPVSLHVCYADKSGDIAYWMAGKNPVRAPGVDPRLPLLGDGSQDYPQPIAYHPMPHAVNPAQGYFGGWNNKSEVGYNNPNDTMPDSILQFGPFHRAHVVEDFLSKKGKFSFEQLRDLSLRINLSDSFNGVDSPRFTSGGNTWKFVRRYFGRAVLKHFTWARFLALRELLYWNGSYIDGGTAALPTATVRSDAWTLQNAWITEMIRLTFEDELATANQTWQDQPIHTLLNVLLHQLAGEDSGVVNQNNWFLDRSTSGKPEHGDELIVLALDNTLAALGDKPWKRPRGTITFVSEVFGPLTSIPYASRANYAQAVEMGACGPTRIESVFDLGQSGNISGIDPHTGELIFDPNFFSMLVLFYTPYEFRPFPLFAKASRPRLLPGGPRRMGSRRNGRTRLDAAIPHRLSSGVRPRRSGP